MFIYNIFMYMAIYHLKWFDHRPLPSPFSYTIRQIKKVLIILKKCFYKQIINWSKQKLAAYSSKRILIRSYKKWFVRRNPNSSEQITRASEQMANFPKEIVICQNK